MSEQTQHFFSLTPERVLAAVERGGMRCTGRILTLNSMENRVYELEMECPDDLPPLAPERYRIAKFYRPGRWTREQILDEHAFLADLVRNEVPVAAPHELAPGSTLGLDEELGIFYALFPKCRGRAPDELQDERLVWMGRLLARLHLSGAAKRAEHRWTLNPQQYGKTNLDYLLANNTLPSEVRSGYISAVERLIALIQPKFEGVENIRIHGDCHCSNILWGTEGPFFLDFDDMLNGPAVQDLWLILPGRDEEAQRQMRLLLEGYEQLRAFDRSSLQLIEPLRSLRYIHYATWIAKRWEDPSFQRAFPHFGSLAYWREQLADLEDQLTVIQEGSWGLRTTSAAADEDGEEEDYFVF